MQKLEKQFSGKGEVKGYEFTQMKESEAAYLYVKSNSDTNTTYYEVVRKIVVPKIDWETKQPTGEFKETYPKSNTFGVDAWDFVSIDAAINKFNSIKIKTV